MSEEREPIIDAMLEELLGGEQPPDLTQRILGAHDAASKSALDLGGVAIDTASHAEAAIEQIPVIDVETQVRPQRSTSSASASNLNFWASAAVILIGASAFGWWYVTSGDAFKYAMQEPDKTEFRKPEIAAVPKPRTPELVEPSSPEPNIPEKATPVQPNPSQIAGNDEPNMAPPTPAPTNRSSDFYADVAPFARELELGETQSRSKIVSFVNRELKRKWDAKRIKPLPPVPDAIWQVRATQFVVGRNPTPGERNRFARDRDREAVIEALLEHEDFANHWSGVIADTLIPHGQDNDNPARLAERKAFRDWLAQSLREDVPYDQLAYEMIAAAGSPNPESDQFNPATSFLLANRDSVQTNHGTAIKVGATDKVCNVFLGRETACARCHDHEGTTQEQYHQIAACFAQLRRLGPNRSPDGSPQLVNANVRGSDGDFASADLFFTDGEENGISVFPEFDGQQLSSNSGLVKEVDRRAEVAQMIVRSDDFAKAAVNRIWMNGLGRELSEAEFPQLAEQLATQFQNEQFNIKSVLSWVAMSSAFDRRESTTIGDAAFAVFASFEGRRGKAIEPYQNIGAPLDAVARSFRNGPGGKVLGNAGPQDGKPKPADRVQERFQQMADEKAFEPLMRTGRDDLIGRLLSNKNLSDAQRVEHLFYKAIGRKPKRNELGNAMEVLKPAVSYAERAKALARVVTILLGSVEYESQH